jgi:hypothetical protein
MKVYRVPFIGSSWEDNLVMLKQDPEIEKTALAQPASARKAARYSAIAEPALLLCAGALVLCTAFMAAPLQRLAGTPTSAHMPGGHTLVGLGSWLPNNLHLSFDAYFNWLGSANVDFLLLMAAAFVIYGLCALLVRFFPLRFSRTELLALIVLAAFVAGLVFVCTPALLSHDAFVYAGYGRLLVVYHANPYFVPFSAHWHDPIFQYDDWGSYTAAYGPLWMAVCSLSTLVAGSDPTRYLLFFRLFGLACHLANALLIALILQKMGRTPRIVALGTLLYALNPLLLLESSQGAHNDIFMITLILLGVLFTTRAEQSASGRLYSAILPACMFALAALVKYTAAPLIVLFVILLAARSLRPESDLSLNVWKQLARRWKPALLAALVGAVSSILVILAGYGIFFFGHDLRAIAQSFISPPSSSASHKSILDGVALQLKHHPSPSGSWLTGLLTLLNNHSLWTLINIVTLLFAILISAWLLWRSPTARSFVLASLLTLGAFLLVAPWFLPWYVTWLVGLAALCLPAWGEPLARSLVAFALTFSVTAMLLYLYNGVAPGGEWNLASVFFTFGPPIAAFLIALLPWPTREKSGHVILSEAKNP